MIDRSTSAPVPNQHHGHHHQHQQQPSSNITHSASYPVVSSNNLNNSSGTIRRSFSSGSAASSVVAASDIFDYFFSQLLEMGVAPEVAHAALVATKVQSVAAAVDYIFSGINNISINDNNNNNNSSNVASIVPIAAPGPAVLSRPPSHPIFSHNNQLSLEEPLLPGEDLSESDIVLHHSISHEPTTPTSPDIREAAHQVVSASRGRPRTRENLIQKLAFVAAPGVKETFYCCICMENVEAEAGFTLSNCSHRFCQDCISMYCKLKIEDEGVVNIKCPHDGNCAEEVSSVDIELLVTPATFVKYGRFKLNRENPNNRQCPKCDTDQIGNPRHPEMTCPNCGFTYCFVHGEAHTNTSCRQYERQRRDEIRLTKATISHTAKKCPGCGSPIEKVSGCNHMTCSLCQVHFCWLCRSMLFDGSNTYPIHFASWNLMGCAGKQMIDGDDDECTCSYAALLVLKILIRIILYPPMVVGIIGFFIAFSWLLMPLFFIGKCKDWEFCSHWMRFCYTVLSMFRYVPIALLVFIAFVLLLALFPITIPCMYCNREVIASWIDDD